MSRFRAGMSFKCEHPGNEPIVRELYKLYQEFSGRGQEKLSFTLSKALKSLKKYPLPITSGNDAKVLDGVGDFVAAKIGNICNDLGLRECGNMVRVAGIVCPASVVDVARQIGEVRGGVSGPAQGLRGSTSAAVENSDNAVITSTEASAVRETFVQKNTKLKPGKGPWLSLLAIRECIVSGQEKKHSQSQSYGVRIVPRASALNVLEALVPVVQMKIGGGNTGLEATSFAAGGVEPARLRAGVQTLLTQGLLRKSRSCRDNEDVYALTPEGAAAAEFEVSMWFARYFGGAAAAASSSDADRRQSVPHLITMDIGRLLGVWMWSNEQWCCGPWIEGSNDVNSYMQYCSPAIFARPNCLESEIVAKLDHPSRDLKIPWLPNSGSNEQSARRFDAAVIAIDCDESVGEEMQFGASDDDTDDLCLIQRDQNLLSGGSEADKFIGHRTAKRARVGGLEDSGSAVIELEEVVTCQTLDNNLIMYSDAVISASRTGAPNIPYLCDASPLAPKIDIMSTERLPKDNVIIPSKTVFATSSASSSTASLLEPVLFTPSNVLSDEWEIVLLLDNREIRNRNDRGFLQSALLSRGVACEVRQLSLGDMVWIARRTTKTMNHVTREVGLQVVEYVMDCIVERKRVDDLAASIVDGRYEEQKYRLGRCGLRRVVYLCEGSLSAQDALPAASLRTALMTTSVHHGFRVYCTASCEESVALLQRLHVQLISSVPFIRSSDAEKSCLSGVKPGRGTIYAHIRNWLPEPRRSYNDFCVECTKSKELTVRFVFGQMLRQVQIKYPVL